MDVERRVYTEIRFRSVALRCLLLLLWRCLLVLVLSSSSSSSLLSSLVAGEKTLDFIFVNLSAVHVYSFILRPLAVGVFLSHCPTSKLFRRCRRGVLEKTGQSTDRPIRPSKPGQARRRRRCHHARWFTR